MWREMGRGAVVAFAVLAAASQPSTAQQSGSPSDDLAARAEQARLSDRTVEAIALYRKALDARPRWAEGWWYLATLLYDRGEHADAATAFRQATALSPDLGNAWVMLGLCEFQLQRHDEALAHIQKGRALGTSADPQFQHVMLYHEGVLLLDRSEFERAQETLGLLSADGVQNDELITALGLAVLRIRPSDPAGADPGARELIRRAGRAEHLAARKQYDESRQEYERLARDFSTTKNVNYALGRHFTATRRPERAIEAFEREIEQSPGHVPARLGIAAIKAETDPAAALPYAEEAVRLNPRVPLGHYLLGTLLLHTPEIDRAIAELETAERAVRDDPGLYYALGRAYARAGRTRDAQRARAIFTRLTDERQRAAQRAAGEGREP